MYLGKVFVGIYAEILVYFLKDERTCQWATDTVRGSGVSYFDLGSSLGSALRSWHKFRAATVTVCGEVCRVLLGHSITSWTVLTLL